MVNWWLFGWYCYYYCWTHETVGHMLQSLRYKGSFPKATHLTPLGEELPLVIR